MTKLLSLYELRENDSKILEWGEKEGREREMGWRSRREDVAGQLGT
jgi:hypothetical protein